MVDGNTFIRNQNERSLEELAPYEGQYVAWTEDGKRIVAHAPTLPELFAEADRLGITRYVIDFIFPPDEVCLGGALLYLSDESVPWEEHHERE